MNVAQALDPELAEKLPETHALLAAHGLVVHSAVERVTLHGSRGPRGGARADSDLDLCLIVGSSAVADVAMRDALPGAVLRTTLRNWRSSVRLDAAAVFDTSGCGLRCFDRSEFDPDLCPETVGCMGVFKLREGGGAFDGGPAVDARRMYPLMVIWRRGRPVGTDQGMLQETAGMGPGFREIVDGDVPGMFAVRTATRENPLSLEELAALGITETSVRAMIRTTHRGWLCEVDGRVVGFAMGNGSTGEMWVIAVLPEFEGRGIGRRLLASVEEWLWSLGWREAWLTTDTDTQLRAYEFYRGRGWKASHVRDGDLYMVKRNPNPSPGPDRGEPSCRSPES